MKDKQRMTLQQPARTKIKMLWVTLITKLNFRKEKRKKETHPTCTPQLRSELYYSVLLLLITLRVHSLFRFP
jgi:hypothetical protein